jgi:hypothetical protein
VSRSVFKSLREYYGKSHHRASTTLENYSLSFGLRAYIRSEFLGARASEFTPYKHVQPITEYGILPIVLLVVLLLVLYADILPKNIQKMLRRKSSSILCWVCKEVVANNNINSLRLSNISFINLWLFLSMIDHDDSFIPPPAHCGFHHPARKIKGKPYTQNLVLPYSYNELLSTRKITSNLQQWNRPIFESCIFPNHCTS